MSVHLICLFCMVLLSCLVCWKCWSLSSYFFFHCPWFSQHFSCVHGFLNISPVSIIFSMVFSKTTSLLPSEKDVTIINKLYKMTFDYIFHNSHIVVTSTWAHCDSAAVLQQKRQSAPGSMVFSFFGNIFFMFMSHCVFNCLSSWNHFQHFRFPEMHSAIILFKYFVHFILFSVYNFYWLMDDFFLKTTFDSFISPVTILEIIAIL